MLSTIIVSPSLEQRQKTVDRILDQNGLSLNHPDLFFLGDDEKLGVEAVKKIKEFLSLKPYSAKGRGVAIISAHKLTLDAQNSLLKILEEPPESSIILLGAESDKNFLPTILSRCRVVSSEFRVQSSELEKLYPDIEKLIGSNMDERFAFVEKIEDKETFIRALVSYFSNAISSNQSVISTLSEVEGEKSRILDFSKKLLDAEKYLSAKGNPRAILEYLMLNLPSKQLPTSNVGSCLNKL